MKKYFTIHYDVITTQIEIDTDMSSFESFGLLEAAKIMIADQWIKNTDKHEE